MTYTQDDQAWVALGIHKSHCGRSCGYDEHDLWLAGIALASIPPERDQRIRAETLRPWRNLLGGVIQTLHRIDDYTDPALVAHKVGDRLEAFLVEDDDKKDES